MNQQLSKLEKQLFVLHRPYKLADGREMSFFQSWNMTIKKVTRHYFPFRKIRNHLFNKKNITEAPPVL